MGKMDIMDNMDIQGILRQAAPVPRGTPAHVFDLDLYCARRIRHMKKVLGRMLDIICHEGQSYFTRTAAQEADGLEGVPPASMPCRRASFAP